jgi:hypothetical protein
MCTVMFTHMIFFCSNFSFNVAKRFYSSQHITVVIEWRRWDMRNIHRRDEDGNEILVRKPVEMRPLDLRWCRAEWI